MEGLGLLVDRLSIEGAEKSYVIIDVNCNKALK